VIRYALVCESGHEFESWFRSADDYERQQKKRLVSCPLCDSVKTEKRIMRPALARGARSPKQVEMPPAAEQKAPVAMISPQEQELRTKLRELREHVTRNADNVGDKFPELARQMHHEEIERRSIYGNARPDEVRSLLDEGVEVQPLPVLPEERN
jgi:hypothetical protein